MSKGANIHHRSLEKDPILLSIHEGFVLPYKAVIFFSYGYLGKRKVQNRMMGSAPARLDPIHFSSEICKLTEESTPAETA